MNIRLVENLMHRGTVFAEGFLFSAKLLPETEIRRRVVSLWQTDARIFRHNEAIFLQLPQTIRVDCRAAAGLPLVRYDRVLSAFPLSKTHLPQFKDAGEAVIFLEAGAVRAIEMREFAIEAIETWFDVAGFSIVETATLGEIKTKPTVVEKRASVNLREELSGVPPTDAQINEILKVLRQKKAESAKNKTNRILSDASLPNSNFSNAAFPNFLASAFGSIRNLFAGNNKDKQNAVTDSKAPPPATGKLRKLVTKALFQMRVAQIFGRKQAKYLAEMMEMFERGDLTEALKHAIPLEDMQALHELTEQTPFLGFLRPRDDLRIQTARQRAVNSAVFLADDWFAQLRQTYRQTFERLVAQNKIEEAAFVLAELLKSSEEAVAFLEKHGKLRLAAELAEARDLPKETIVRQWFLAGEQRRAVQLAILHNCFEYVVTKLEAENHQQSRNLRELWAESLAASGNLPAAINAIWSLEDRRDKARNWIDATIEFGGVPAAQMLVKKIVAFPESFAEVREKLFEFLDDADSNAIEKRVAFAREAISQRTAREELRVLARLLARKMLAEWSTIQQQFSPHDFRRLIETTNDFALRADLPALQSIQTGAAKNDFFELEIAAEDRGANPVFDACLLPDGKTAVALGEAGVKILSGDNKTIAHFDFPTQKFVVSDSGTKAIGLMPRGESHRLTRFDFVARRAGFWCDAAFLAFAPTFDGNLWFVGLKDAFYAIDANAADFEAIWNVSDIGGSVSDIARSKTKLVLLINSKSGFEKWSYDLPNLVLRSRNQVKGWHETRGENQLLSDLSASIAYSVAVKREPVAENEARFDVEIFDYETRVAQFQAANGAVAVGKPLVVENYYAIASRARAETIVDLYTLPNKKIAAFRLHDPTPDSSASSFAFAKLDETFLTIADNAGRLIVFEYRTATLRKNLRH